jgi:hypothetical protein
MGGIMRGDLGIGAADLGFRLFVGLVLRTVALAWRSALAGAAGVGARASPALARRAALKMERAHRLMQIARLCEDGEAYEEAEAGYEYARAVYEGRRAHGA